MVIASFTDDHSADVRWAALLHDIGKPPTFSIEEDRIHFNEHASMGGDLARNILDRLQCSSRRRDKIVWLIAHHMMMATFSKIDDKRKAHWYYHPWFIELLQLFWLDAAGAKPKNFTMYDDIIDDYNHFLDSHPRPPTPILDGEEVMEMLGLEPGERVGEVLKELYDAQLRKDVTKKEEAKEFIKKMI